jgi:hypothetical protein
MLPTPAQVRLCRQSINRAGQSPCHHWDQSRPVAPGLRKTLYIASSAGGQRPDGGRRVGASFRSTRGVRFPQLGVRTGPASGRCQPSRLAPLFQQDCDNLVNLRQARGSLSYDLVSARFAHFHGTPSPRHGSGASEPRSLLPARGSTPLPRALFWALTGSRPLIDGQGARSSRNAEWTPPTNDSPVMLECRVS